MRRICCIAVLVAFGMGAPDPEKGLESNAAVLESLPATPFGDSIRAWYRAVCSGDLQDLTEVVEAAYGPELRGNTEDRVDQLSAISRQHANSTLDSAGGDAESAWLIMSNGSTRVRFWFTPSSSDLGRIGTHGARLLPGPEVVPLARLATYTAFRAEMARQLEVMEASGDFAGVVYVARDGAPLFEKAVGLASRRYGVPNSIDTRFNLGSAQKIVTATAVLRLVEQGKIDLDATVGNYLPMYPNESVRERVTIHDLLSHRSGLGTHFTEEFQASRRDQYRTIQDYLPLFVEEDPEFEPGSAFRYSNVGYFILGMVVEAVTGSSFEELVRAVVYEPAGMLDSGAFDLDGAAPRIATGYYRDDEAGIWRSNISYVSVRGTPAGGTYATAIDLARFFEAWLDGDLLSEATLERMIRVSSEIPGSASAGYGYGTTIRTLKGGEVSYGHAGGYVGVSAVMRVYPRESGHDTVIVLSNVDGAAPAVARMIEQLLPIPGAAR